MHRTDKYHRGIGTWPARRRRKDPDKVALVAAGVRRTYGELADRAERLSALLASHGVTTGDAVAFVGGNSPELLETLFATTRLGAVFVPVNTRLAAPEVAHVLRDTGAVVVIHQTESAATVADSVGAAGSDRLRQVIPLGAGLEMLLRSAGPIPPAAEVSDDHPAVILYTSGTTGSAKGAVLTHANLTWQSMNVLIDYDVVSSDVLLLAAPLFHAAALGMGALPVLLKGGTIILEPAFDAGATLELIERQEVTMLSGVPTTLQRLTAHPGWATSDLRSLRTITCGGAATPLAVIEQFEARGIAFTQGYGMTECSPGATSLPAHRSRTKQGSVGLPHFFTDVRVTTPDGTTAATGAVGEIEIAGPNVFAGYLNLPTATRHAFTHDGYYRSGDLGYLDHDGCLYVVDRLRDIIISGAENIYPAEVEAHVAQIDGVTAAAVIGVPCDTWGEVPLAVVTVRDDVELTAERLRAELDGKIARYKIPKRVVVVDAIPRTGSGKVRKQDLRRQVVDTGC